MLKTLKVEIRIVFRLTTFNFSVLSKDICFKVQYKVANLNPEATVDYSRFQNQKI